MDTVASCALSAFGAENAQIPAITSSDVIPEMRQTPDEIWASIGTALASRSGLLFDLPEPRERMLLRWADGGAGDMICANCRTEHATGWRLVLSRGRRHVVCRECVKAYALPVGAILVLREDGRVAS